MNSRTATSQRVLIADDDLICRTVLGKQLSNIGYEPILCDSGKGALEQLCREDGPSLAILDWGMPDSDGLEVIRQIRMQPALRYIYILMLTSKTTEADLIAALGAGADDFLKKPYSCPELRARLAVGGRIVQRDADITKLLKEKESLGHQHDLLSEIVVNRGKSDPSPSTPGVKDCIKLSDKAIQETSNLAEYVDNAFAQFGVMDMKPLDQVPQEYMSPGQFVIYGNVMDVQLELWLDLWVEFSRAAALTVFKSVSDGEPGSDQELLDFLGEIGNLLQGCFKRDITKNGRRAITPLLPQRHTYAQVADALALEHPKTFYFGNSECKIKLILCENSAPTKVKPKGGIAFMDVILEPFAHPSRPDFVLIPGSTAVTGVLLNRVRSLAWVNDPKTAGNLPVLEASSLARSIMKEKTLS